jgi:hypothetical protein
VRRRAGWRPFSSEPLEVGEPDLDERPHGILEPGFASDLQGLLVALPRLLRRNSLLQPVVPGDEELLDPPARLRGLLHVVQPTAAPQAARRALAGPAFGVRR